MYTTALRVLVPDDAALSFQLLFGYVGAMALVTLLPVTGILAATAPQVFTGLTPTVFGFIVVNGLCDNVLSDYLWVRRACAAAAAAKAPACLPGCLAAYTRSPPPPLAPSHDP